MELSKHSSRAIQEYSRNIDYIFTSTYYQNCEDINHSVIVKIGMVNIPTINFDIEFFLLFVTEQGCYDANTTFLNKHNSFSIEDHNYYKI